MVFSAFFRFIKNLRYLSKYNLKDFNTFLENLDNYTQCVKYQTKADWENIVTPKIKDNFSTLYELVNTEKSLIRLGDGEFTLIEGRDIPFQSYDKRLAHGLIEILKSNYNNLLVGLAWEHFHINSDLRDFIKQAVYTSIPSIYKTIEKNIDPQKVYYSAAISQIYATYKQYDFEKHFSLMRQIWENKSVTIICGDRVFNNIKYNIFDNAKDVRYIYGPTMHAYKDFDILKEKIMQVSKDNILIFALGPCGKLLAYEMFKQGYRVLDLGHSIKDYNEYKNNTQMTRKEIVKFLKPD